MHIFIDANILLDLYHMSGPDLDELRKVIKLAESKKINVLIQAQVWHEFMRNRERVISEALALFEKTKATTTLPNVVRGYAKIVELRAAVEKTNQLAKELLSEVSKDARAHTLNADKLVEELFKVCPPTAIPTAVLARARERRDLGNPPGKQNSLGDGIHWEWLLETVPPNENLHILSTDSDFESELTKGQSREYLIREWETAKGSELRLYKTLPQFFKKHFPDIKLSDEIEKVVAIENLEQTFSFASTHAAISKLNKFDDFSDGELLRLLTAVDDNNQIAWILGDDDVKAFAKKLVALSQSEQTKAKSTDLAKKLATLDEIQDLIDPAKEVPF